MYEINTAYVLNLMQCYMSNLFQFFQKCYLTQTTAYEYVPERQ